MTDTRPGKLPLHAQLTEAAHAGWHDTAAERGVSTSALLEAIGLELAGGRTEFDLAALAKQARKVDTAHRRRLQP